MSKAAFLFPFERVKKIKSHTVDERGSVKRGSVVIWWWWWWWFPSSPSIVGEASSGRLHSAHTCGRRNVLLFWKLFLQLDVFYSPHSHLKQRFVKFTAHDESEAAHVSHGYCQQTFTLRTAVINLTELQIFYTEEAAGRWCYSWSASIINNIH